MMGERDQGHHGQRGEQVGAEDAVRPVRAEGEVTGRVERAEQEKNGKKAEYNLAQGIEQQPASQLREGRAASRLQDRPPDQAEVAQGSEREEPWPPAIGWHRERNPGHQHRPDNQQVDHRLFLQLRQVLCADGREFAADMMNDDPHHEHPCEQIEQDAHFDKERHRVEQ